MQNATIIGLFIVMPHIQLAGQIDNADYYQGDLGHTIMDSENFSPEIELYLSTELAICATLVAQHGYQYFVEFGCGTLRLAGACLVGEAWYFGIDVREAIRYRNRSFIQSHNLQRCRFIRGKADRIASLASRLLKKTGFPVKANRGLVVLPFNFIGNLRNLSEFMGRLSSTRQDLLISQFSTDPRTAPIRLDYYRSCGLHLEIKHDSFGCAFGDGASFLSYAYHAEYVDTIMANHGYRRVINFTSHIHHIAHYRHVAADMSSPIKIDVE